jgi:hypothetical protein
LSRFSELFGGYGPIIGMIHLPPLPDYDHSPGIDAIIDSALRDLRVLRDHNFNGVLIENEYDRPHRVRALPATIEYMTCVTETVVMERGRVAVGCEILLNDPAASLAVAKAAGASFIRTDYFVDRMARTEYGEFHIDPDGLLAQRASLDATDILILADIQVKYATMLEERTLTESAALATRHCADAIVVSGNATGDAPTVGELVEARKGAGVPVIIGSGLDALNAASLLPVCDGAIVGTALMTDRCVDSDKARPLMEQISRIRT